MKTGPDYIPTEAELARKRELQKERQAAQPDPQKDYVAKYKANGMPITERVAAVSVVAAEEHIKQQASLVGWIVSELELREASEENK